MIQSICIVRLSALGDVLMVVPLIRRLQDALPQVKITWIISRPAFDLVEGMDGIDFIVIGKPNNLRDYWEFRKKISDKRFDVLLACQASFRANLLYPFIRAKLKIGYDKLRAKDGHHLFVHQTIAPGCDHTLEGFLKFADSLSLPKTPLRWDLPIMDADYQWAKEHLPVNKRIFLVNAAASKPERSWLVERYIKVIKRVQQYENLAVVLVGGPGTYDRELAQAILTEVSCIDLVGKTKPKQLLAVISLADLLLCPDTGPSHMGAAVGTPVIALHAVTSANVSGPYTYRHLSVDYYPEAVKTILNSCMEENVWGTHAHGSETMKLVPVEPVLHRIEEVLNSEANS